MRVWRSEGWLDYVDTNFFPQVRTKPLQIFQIGNRVRFIWIELFKNQTPRSIPIRPMRQMYRNRCHN